MSSSVPGNSDALSRATRAPFTSWTSEEDGALSLACQVVAFTRRRARRCFASRPGASDGLPGWRAAERAYILHDDHVCHALGDMPRRYPPKPATRSHVDEPKVAMSYRLSPAKIARAQRVLGTPTATSTIEEALDLVVFRQELIDGVEQGFGVEIHDVFPGSNASKRRKRS